MKPCIVTENYKGQKVFGKFYSGKITPLKYSNRTGAQKKADECGGIVLRYAKNGPFYVAPLEEVINDVTSN